VIAATRSPAQNDEKSPRPQHLGHCPQRPERAAGEREFRRQVAERSQFAHQAILDAARRAAHE
jgi:hypothetical protein